ncbi:MAG: ribonuclease J [Christensenella sp.]|uniref:ribonuclease J n=1 Tax=Christensenella sp. TaxID=1935934 RepID=UPI002B220C8D|nr:ribonuclease J [Christensenella sp.]MEA5004425.1 ribonuclease J [Christensenella sp.]
MDTNRKRDNNLEQKNHKAKKPEHQQKKNEKKSVPSLKIIPLGGIGEIGKNMTVIEYGNDIIVVDAGMMFPREEMLGVDYVIADTTYLQKNIDKIRGIFFTHGHEDHIGGVPYILQKMNVPMYGSTLTMALIEAKLTEHPGVVPDIHVVGNGEKVKAGVFTVEFVKVSHSIDDAMGLAITTPLGMLVHTGDFKIDLTPACGEVMELSRFAEFGKKGVLALMSDSTNAERSGFTMSESQVGETFVNYFRQAKGRVIVASFASNVHRIQQVIDVAKIFNKKICLSGRSMLKIVGVTRELGYLNVDDDMFVSFDEIKKLRDNQVVILTTGSQGETMSGLVRMAMGQHAKINIKEGDLVIISASPIPGNERYVSDVINMLYRKGANVINDAVDMVHVSGHACQEELKLMLSLVKPKYFIPVHGEYRHLYKHAALAEKMGIKKKNIFIPEIGSVIELNRRMGLQKDTVQSGSVLIDGLGVGDVGNVVLRDRKQLSSDGLFIVVVTIANETGELISTPDIVSRGFVYMKESEDLLERSKSIVTEIVDMCKDNGTSDWSTLKNFIRKDLSNYLYDMTQRSPMILPIIIEV